MKLNKPKRRSWEPEKVTTSEWVSPDKKFYNSTGWRKHRERFMNEYPLCAECERNNKLTPGKAVDHITPIREGGHRWSWSNLQTLCLSCHAIKTRKENDKRMPKNR